MPQWPSRALRLMVGLVTLLPVLAWPHSSHAQITTDGSLGPARTLSGPSVTVGSDLGRIRGANLFHSFGQFNVDTGQSVTFTGPSSIGNILSRVTGGSPSTIDGLLRSTIPGANMFLLNPSGVLFGPNAALDIGGSFHVTTADYIRFPDGGMFQANLARPTLLSVAQPAAFGFLSARPAPVVVQRNSLEVSRDRSLSLVGGDVSVVDGFASGGRISLISVGGRGEATFNAITQTPDLALRSGVPGGQIALRGTALSIGSTVRGGRILIRGGRLVAEVSVGQVINPGLEDGDAVAIDIDVANDMIVDNSKFFAATVFARGGDITVRARRMTITGALSEFTAGSSGSGAGGDIVVDVDRVVLAGGMIRVGGAGSGAAASSLRIRANSIDVVPGDGFDSTGLRSSTSGPSRAGDIVIDVGRLTLAGRSAIIQSTSSSFDGDSTGPAGTVTINASESVSLSEGAAILTFSNNTADAGRVTVSAPALSISNAFIGGPTSGVGRGGDINLNVGRLLLSPGAGINSSTSGAGNGGSIIIRARESIKISATAARFSSINTASLARGDAGRIVIATPVLTVTGGGATISAGTNGPGRGGDVVISVGRLMLAGRQVAIASISDSPDGGLTGPAGNVTINASESVSLSDRAVILTDTTSASNAGRITVKAPAMSISSGALIGGATFGAGRGGDIIVNVAQLLLSSGGMIDSTSFGVGAGGNVTVTAAGLVTILGVDATTGFPSGLSSNALFSGPGGNVVLRAQNIVLKDGGGLEAQAIGNANAGNLTIIAGDSFRSFGALVTTRAVNGKGGNIVMTVPRLVHLVDSEVTTSVQGGAGNGGNITIDPQFLILDHSEIRADAVGGPGGNVTLVADVFLRNDSVLSASSALGAPGVVNVQAQVSDVTGTLEALPESVLQGATLLSNTCRVRIAEGRTSSFVLAGRGGLPPGPEGLLPSPLLEEATTATSMPASPSFSPIVLTVSCR